ncbi:MAG: dTMP kinase [Exilispira sp.]|jgi:dTMP kinase|nr:dTMP kinase [Exilispira sp.]
MKNSKNGLFVVFEGIDKSGKTTQLNLVKEKLLKDSYKIKDSYRNIFTTFEPGDSAIGDKIRPILLNSDLHLTNLTEFLLFISDRLEHTVQFIKKKLDEKDIVIVDRFHFSTFAYQVFPAIVKIQKKEYEDDIELKRLKTLVKMDKIFGDYLFSLIEPDIIFYFYNDRYFLNKEKGYKINLEKQDRFESRGDGFLEKVMLGYKKSFCYYRNFKKKVNIITFSNGIEYNRDFICKKIYNALVN